MFENGSYAPFIIGSYAVTVIVLLALILWLVIDGRQLRKTLKRYEEQGLTRRRRSSTERRHSDESDEHLSPSDLAQPLDMSQATGFNRQEKQSNA